MKTIRSLMTAFPVLLLLLTSPALAAGSTKVIMVAGDHAPDGNGVFSSTLLTTGGLNDAGQTAFSAQLVGTANGSLDNAGLFRGDGTTLVQIARTGQSFGPGGVFSTGLGLVGTPALNQSGQVVFPAFLSVTDGGGTSGIFTGSGTPESLTQIVRQGQAVPSGNGVFGTLFSSSALPTLNDSGQVAFYTPIENSTRSQKAGLFRGDGTNIAQIAVLNTPAFGSTNFGNLSAGPVLNRTGTVAFAGSLVNTNTLATGSALVVSDGITSTFYARSGQGTPDGNGTFSSSLAPFHK